MPIRCAVGATATASTIDRHQPHHSLRAAIKFHQPLARDCITPFHWQPVVLFRTSKLPVIAGEVATPRPQHHDPSLMVAHCRDRLRQPLRVADVQHDAGMHQHTRPVLPTDAGGIPSTVNWTALHTLACCTCVFNLKSQFIANFQLLNFHNYQSQQAPAA